MFKCICGKEVKTQQGLKRHQAGCDAYLELLETLEETETPKEINVIAEQRKEPSAKDRLSKVADAIRCCQDAQAKHFLEEEYKSLGGNLADLRK